MHVMGLRIPEHMPEVMSWEGIMLLVLCSVVLSELMHCKPLQWHCNNDCPAAIQKGCNEQSSLSLWQYTTAC